MNIGSHFAVEIGLRRGVGARAAHFAGIVFGVRQPYVYDLTSSCCSLGGAGTGSSCSHFFPGGVCTLTPSLRSRVTSSVLSDVKMTV